MRITLVQPPSAREDPSELAPPAGLLHLAAAAREDDCDVDLLDLNLAGVRSPDWVNEGFYDAAVEAIAARAPDLVGFTSMALESHLCLEIARRLKRMDPQVRIVLGGPHFSSIASEVLTLYPWVDFVVTGEGESALVRIASQLRDGRPLDDAPNVAHRSPGGELRLVRALKPHASLDRLPAPAWDLVDLDAYFALNPYHTVDVEHARGCPLRCAFCYSPVHWGQGEQQRSVEWIVEQAASLAARGAWHVFFVADNLVADRRYAMALCAALADADTGVTWNCYASLAQLDEPLVTAMAQAGCVEIFIGVDAVTEDAKQRFQKRYFRGEQPLNTVIRRCVAAGITPTCAIMIDPPSFGVDATDRCLDVALLAAQAGACVRLNSLAEYPGTEIARRSDRRGLRYSSTPVRYLFDTHALNRENPFAQRRPDLFPLHATREDEQSLTEFLGVLRLAFDLLHGAPGLLAAARARACGPWPLLHELAAEQDFHHQPHLGREVLSLMRYCSRHSSRQAERPRSGAGRGQWTAGAPAR